MRTVTVKKEEVVAIDSTQVVQEPMRASPISKAKEWKLLYSPSARSGCFGLNSSQKDLCTVCAKLSTCTYPKPEAGIWHCRDYQQEAK